MSWQGGFGVRRHRFGAREVPGVSSQLERARPPARARRGWHDRTAGRARSRLRAGERNAGFGLIEVLVAVMLLTVVIVIVLRATATSLAASVVAKEHTVATSLITQAVAEATALPFAELQSGLDPSSTADPGFATDPNITGCSTTSGSETCTFVPTGATIDANNTDSTGSPEPPIVPHISTETVGATYTIKTYPTVSSSTPQLVTLNVIVTWPSPTGGTSQVSGQTQIAAP